METDQMILCKYRLLPSLGFSSIALGLMIIRNVWVPVSA
jgi:hypothetical protein